MAAAPTIAGAGAGALFDLGTGAGQDEQRDWRLALRQVVHEGQHRVVGPVQVLDDQHRGSGGSEALEELSPGGEVLLAGGFFCLKTHERAQARPQAVTVGALGQDRLEACLGAGDAVALEDAGRVAHDPGERPEGDAGAEGQAAALAPDDEPGMVAEAAGQLGEQSALADAGLADEKGTAETSVGDGLVEQGLELGELVLPADELGAEAAQLGAGARQRRGRDPGAQRFLLALHRDRVAGVEGEGLLGGGVGGLADGDGHRWGHRLQARRHVDGVAGEEALAARGVDVGAHERLAGVDPDADLDRSAADARQGVELVDDAQAGAHGALGVVLVHGRHAEDGDHGVADELLDRAAVGLDRRAGGGVEALQEGVDELGVVALGERGEADEVADEGGDDATFLDAPRGGRTWLPGG